jgi:hypothetical protein
VTSSITDGWLDYHGIDEATEREHIRLSVETIRRLTGTRPIGWYIGTPSANTRRLVDVDRIFRHFVFELRE